MVILRRCQEKMLFAFYCVKETRSGEHFTNADCRKFSPVFWQPASEFNYSTGCQVCAKSVAIQLSIKTLQPK